MPHCDLLDTLAFSLQPRHCFDSFAGFADTVPRRRRHHPLDLLLHRFLEFMFVASSQCLITDLTRCSDVFKAPLTLMEYINFLVVRPQFYLRDPAHIFSCTILHRRHEIIACWSLFIPSSLSLARSSLPERNRHPHACTWPQGTVVCICLPLPALSSVSFLSPVHSHCSHSNSVRTGRHLR